MYSGDEVGAIVFDIGSHSVRAGYAGDDAPKFVFPSHVGIIHPMKDKMETDKPTNLTDYYIGNQALCFRRDFMEIENPFKNGLVDNWNHFEQLIKHSYDANLGIKSNEHPLLIAEPPFTTLQQREKTIQLLFENFDCPAVFLSKSPVLASFAAGKTTALVVDSGYGQTCVTPVNEGYALTGALIKHHQAGEYINEQILKYFQNSKTDILPNWSFSKRKVKDKWSLTPHSFPNTTKSFYHYSQQSIIEDIKHSIFQVSETPIDELRNTTIPTMIHELNNCKEVEIGVDRLSIPELIFCPKGSDSKGLHIMANESASKCDPDIKKDILSNIILVGGNTQFQNLSKRFEKDITNKVINFKIKSPIVPPSLPASKQTVWLGGSILASLGSFQQMWVSKEEFKEFGSSIVHKKCP